VTVEFLRTRRPISHQESWWWTVGRWIAAGSVAMALWFGVDWIRCEDWIFQLLGALPELHENEIKYLVLITAGWLGWSIALFEGLVGSRLCGSGIRPNHLLQM